MLFNRSQNTDPYDADSEFATIEIDQWIVEMPAVPGPSRNRGKVTPDNEVSTDLRCLRSNLILL